MQYERTTQGLRPGDHVRVWPWPWTTQFWGVDVSQRPSGHALVGRSGCRLSRWVAFWRVQRAE